MIIVDDASPTPVADYADSRIRVLRNISNRGKPASVNRALDLAHGKFVAFLDDDDAWSPERLFHASSAHRRADLAVCLTRTMGETRDFGKRQCNQMVRSHMRRAKGGIPLGPGGADSVRRDLCPRFDGAYQACEDWDWGIRLWQSKPTFEMIPHPDFVWRQHYGERHGNGADARISGSHRLLKQHREFYQAHKPALAERLYRLWLLYWADRNRDEARICAWRSLRTIPTARAGLLLLRASFRSRM